MNGFDLPIGVAGTARLQGPPAGRRLGDPAIPCTTARCPTCSSCFSPAAERSPQFYVGTFEFDPKFVGFRTEKFPGGFLLDTRLTGNRNSGHEFRDGCRQNGVIGRALSPEERWALVEYLKVLGNPEFERRLVPAQTPTLDARPEMPGAGATDRATLNLEMEKREALAPPPLSTPSSPSPFRGDA